MNDFFKRILMQIVLPCGAWWSYFYLPALFQAWVYFVYVCMTILLLTFVLAGNETLKKVFEKEVKLKWWQKVFSWTALAAWIALFAYAQQAVLLTLMGIVYLLKYARKETFSKNKGV